ncbi:uncharacterized protein HMPREF1541_08622 [Cyphellophora europaea CBS 101466]|uniref:Zn(2)-C6 fungal-type domain-containing protein n=1 Tax=Cyphellophora europaea (strain CBS 101466) TaxID=1220924 RepID=W2RJ34_CYPE1|nr:uncharacterized protein HMPREF1541_08622 [Cyphellophora europaea CBS 101466]ETN36345.1 hypothetical protein HMPREF1541_08622 [Cyphellophora europaea CBS 101466]
MAENQLPEFDPNPQQQATDASAPQFAAPSNAPQPQAQSQPAQREVKRRNRRPVVCMPCRERRSKCSREKPCSLCVKRGEAHLCLYAEPVERAGAQAASRSARAAASRARQLEQLGQLESLFKRYLQGDQANHNRNAKDQGYGFGVSQLTPTATDQDEISPDAFDSSMLPHWSSLFKQLRSTMEGYEDGLSEAGDGVITSEEKPILLGASPASSLSTILRQYLPQNKADVSNRLNTYFGSSYMVIPVIHSGKFLDEYEEFWSATPDTVDPIWVALLFAILSLSAHITAVQGDEADVAQHENWINACSQCLSLGGYTKPRPYLIPALLMLAQSQYMRYLDPSREVSLLISIVVRLAFQSGLHREPGILVTSFEAEMRRRLWVMIRHFDCQIACQFGVPSSIQLNATDIGPPRNLLDNDLNESMTELPPSRPDTELSPVNSFLLKNHFMTLFAEIYTNAHNVQTTANDDASIEHFESLLQARRSQMPPIFRTKPIALSLNDPDALRMFRLTIDFLYHKTLIILHRRRMGDSNSSSRETCINAANSIIVSFGDLITELRPGKLMEGKAWMLSATVVNDFLLASMTLSMAFITLAPNSPASSRKGSNSTINREEILTTLENARTICLDLSPKSRGALRVASALATLLSRYGRDTPMDPRLTNPAVTSSPPQSQAIPAYQPAPPYSLNGFPVGASMPPPSSTQPDTRPPNTQNLFGIFPSPAPSSALSQERSTSSGGGDTGTGIGVRPYPHTSGPYSNWANGNFTDSPMLLGLFPSTAQSNMTQQGQLLQGQAAGGVSQTAAAAGLFVPQGQEAQQAPQGQFVGGNGAGGDVFDRLALGTGAGGLDWTAFDQFITEF